MGFSWHRKDALVYLTSDLLDKTGLIKHGFSTRHGWQGGKATNEFNLGFKNSDPQVVRQMRRTYLSALEINADRLVVGQQVHGTKVALVNRVDAGRGAHSYRDGLPATDALVTTSDVSLGIFTADCVPLLFFDPEKRAIGASHAGWRGSVGKIAIRTLEMLQVNFGSLPADVMVAIGPSIGPCCYEVDDKVLKPLQNSIPWWADVFVPTRTGHGCLNLWELNRRLLVEAGIMPHHIDVARVCTHCCQQYFFSFRGEQGRAGSLMAAISL